MKESVTKPQQKNIRKMKEREGEAKETKPKKICFKQIANEENNKMEKIMK